MFRPAAGSQHKISAVPGLSIGIRTLLVWSQDCGSGLSWSGVRIVDQDSGVRIVDQDSPGLESGLWIRTLLVWSQTAMNALNFKAVIALLGLLLGVMYFYTTHRACDPCELTGRSAVTTIMTHEDHLVSPDHLKYKQPSIINGRKDVVTVTPWLAPVVWEGTFDPDLLNPVYKAHNLSIAVSVFAVGKYIRFLKDFLETAEQHFFVGFNVHIYVFTDQPKAVPQVKMAASRQVSVRSVPSATRWQEISARRMELIQELIEAELHGNNIYIFCLDVDSKFHGHWGAESLGGLVAVIHPGYYKDERSSFPYERRSLSTAYVSPGEGDFYYCGGAFGGHVGQVQRLAKTCSQNFRDDAGRGIEATWQEESHLNRYMWINKPSKILSPEYLWQDFKSREPEIHIIRFSGVVKNYAEIRPNV